MRTLPLALLALALAIPTPAAAQDAGTGIVRVLEDPAGDVQVSDTGQPLPAGGNPFLDIRALDIEEQDEALVFHYMTAGFPTAPEAPVFGSGGHLIRFHHNDATFEIRLWRQVNVQTPVYWTSLFASYGGQPGGSFARLDAAVGDGGLVSITVPRLLLADAQGAPPFPGRALEGFAASSEAAGGSICLTECRRLVDQNDEASSDARFAIQRGALQAGNARLTSPTPFRATNGQAGTTLFEVQAHNLGLAAETFDLSVDRIPANWKVTLPQSQVRIEPGAVAKVPVLLEIPFQHVHGRLQTFVLEMRSPSDAGSVGRIELGLQFVDPPQPAGHHPALYLHSHPPRDELDSASGSAFAYNGPWLSMNTLDTDPQDVGVPVTGRLWGSVGTTVGIERSKFQWTIPLSPGLRMGIDADLAALGDIRLPVGTTLPMDNTVLDGYLAVLVPSYAFEGYINWEPDTEQVVATIPPTAATSIGPNGQALLEGEVRPHPQGDLIPFATGQQLVLVLNLTFDRPATFLAVESPVIQPGGTLRLPLLDYSDPVDQALSTLAGLRLAATDGQERRAPPDSTAVYTLELSGPAGEYRLAAYGANNEWVRFVGGPSVAVGSGPATVQVLVDIPAGTPAELAVDFLVEAAHAEMLDARALTRLRLVADPTAPEAENVPEEVAVESPGAALAVLAVALLGAGGSRRRVYQ